MPQTRYRFGEFELDPASRELWRGGERIALPPKSFECLAYLVAHRDRAVGRDELISAVWGRVDASDTLVAQTLLRARKALDDTGDRQAMIRTVPRFGYRWVAAVQEIHVAAPAPLLEPAAATEATAPAAAAASGRPPGQAPADGAAMPPAPTLLLAPPRRRLRVWMLLAALAALVVAAVIAGWPWHTSRSPAVAASRRQDVALVLPVRVLPSEPETSWVRLGAMDYIASRARRAGVRVLPSDQTLHLSALLEQAGADDGAAWQRLRASSDARWILSPVASRDARGWRVRLQWNDAGHDRLVEAHGSTPLAAAAAATDAWLGREGRHAPQDVPTALTERVQQIDAELTAGQLATVRRLIEQAPAEQRREPRLRVREGQLAYRSGQIEQAERSFQSLLAPVTAAGEADVRAHALMGLGAVDIRRGDFAQAQAHYSQALALLQADGGLDDPAMLGNAYNGRGVAQVQQGRVEEAVHDLGLARIAMQRSGDLVEAAMVGTNLGIIESKRGHYPQALQEFDRAIATYERFGVHDYLAATLASRSDTQLQLAQPAAALASAEQAAHQVGALEDPALAIRVGLACANAQLHTGALQAAQRSLGQLKAAGLNDDAPIMRELSLRLLLARDRRDEAAALARHLPPKETTVDGALAVAAVQAALRGNDLATARQWLARMPADLPPASAVSWQLARGLVAQRDRDRAHALQEIDRLSRTAGTDSPDERIRIAVALALMRLDRDEPQQAAAALGELDAYADSDYRVAWSTMTLYRMLGDAAQAERARAQAEALRGERALATPLVL